MMKRSASALLVLLSLNFASCSSAGGVSGGLIGLITGGAIGALGDELLNEDDEDQFVNNGFNNGTTTGGTGGAVGAATGNTITTTTGNATRTDTNGDGVIDQNDATSGTSTTIVSGGGAAVGTTTMGRADRLLNEHGGLIAGALGGAAAGLVTDQFRKGEIQKKYDEGYAKAKSDSIKEFYWLKRDAQKTMKGGDDPPIQYRYYEVEVPAHTTSDGVLIDRHRRVIEVVE